VKAVALGQPGDCPKTQDETPRNNLNRDCPQAVPLNRDYVLVENVLISGSPGLEPSLCIK